MKIENGEVIEVVGYTADYTEPYVVDFELDLDAGELIFTFSEPVLVASFNYTAHTIQDNETAYISYRLRDGDSTKRNFTHVNVTINTLDLNLLKRDPLIATGIDNTFIVLTSEFATDTNFQPILENLDGEAIQAFQVYPDKTGPKLISFSLNLTSDTLLLTFDEPVNVQSFYAMALTLYAEPESSLNYVLQSSYIGVQADDTTVEISLSTQDANEIKRLPFATSVDDTYLIIQGKGINDTSGNSVQEIPPIDALNVTDYVVDKKSPVVESFTFNLTSAKLVLSFSETVNASSINCGKVCFAVRRVL